MIYRVHHYQTGKFAGRVGDTETTRNQIAMEDRKCRSCKLWSKEAEE